jgi:hypothetical protein
MRRLLLLGILLVSGCRAVGGKAPPASPKMITDLDVKDLLSRMGAPQTPPMPIDNAARILGEFGDAAEFSAWPASGETLWFGQSYNVHGDASSDQSYVFVRLKPGRSAADGLEVLEYSGFSSGLKTDGGSEDADAHTVLKALMRGAAPKPDSKAVEYMRTTSPKDGWHAIAKIDGKSRVMVYDSPRWIRQKGERMLLIEKLPTTSPNRKTPFHAAGRYAELWHIP